MEVFIWLESAFSVLSIASITFLVLLCCGIVVASIIYACEKYSSYPDEDALQAAKNIFKKCIVGAAISLFVMMISTPLSNFSESYKKVLIYRGINSTIVDKSIDTADKALDILNIKLDKQLELLKENPNEVLRLEQFSPEAQDGGVSFK